MTLRLLCRIRLAASACLNEKRVNLNAALMTIGEQIVNGFESALAGLGIKAQTFFSQNDGTLMTGEFTQKYPIFTIGCGPTNSIRGAYHLSGIKMHWYLTLVALPAISVFW